MASSVECAVFLVIGIVQQISFLHGAPVTSSDITITGMTSSGLAYVGDRLQCSASCFPPPDTNGYGYEFSIRGQSAITYSSSIVLTTEGNFQYICKVYNTELGTRYSANQTARVTVFPRQGVATTVRPPGPIVSSDLRVTGLTMTGTNAGYMYVNGLLTCTGYSNPPPAYNAYYWTQHETGQIVYDQSVTFRSTGTATISCTAWNVVNWQSYSASTSRITVTVRARGSSEAQACMWLVLVTSTYTLLLRR